MGESGSLSYWYLERSKQSGCAGGKGNSELHLNENASFPFSFKSPGSFTAWLVAAHPHRLQLVISGLFNGSL
jgi:hypothetical protein